MRTNGRAVSAAPSRTTTVTIFTGRPFVGVAGVVEGVERMM
jgi:hypothetical protein